MSTLRSVDTADVVQASIRAALRDARVALPGRIESYDEGAQKADVFPLLLEAHQDAEGNRQTSQSPVVTSVPILWPGGGGFRLTFPLQRGDTVLLLFADRSLDAWLEAGGVTDPIDPRMHHLSDGVAIPILHDFSRPWTGARTDAVTLGKDGGTQLHLEQSTIRLGSQGAAHPLVQGDAFRTALNLFLGILSTYAGAIKAIADPLSVATPPLIAGITALQEALYLSNVSRTD